MPNKNQDPQSNSLASHTGDVLFLTPEWRVPKLHCDETKAIRQTLRNMDKERYSLLAKELGKRIQPRHQAVRNIRKRISKGGKVDAAELQCIRELVEGLKRDHKIIQDLGWTPNEAIKAYSESRER